MMSRDMETKKFTDELDIAQFDSTILARDLDIDPKLHDLILDRVMDALEIGTRVHESAQFVNAFEQGFAEKDRSLAPSQISLFLPQARAMPEIRLDADMIQAVLNKFLEHDISYYSSLISAHLTPRPGHKSIEVDLARILLVITRNSLGAYYSNLGNVSPGDIRFIPGAIAHVKAAELNSLQRQIELALAKYLSNPEPDMDHEWEKFPEWLFICPRSLLKAPVLKQNEVLRNRLLQALEQHVFLRGFAALHTDDIISRSEYLPLWEVFLKKHFTTPPEHPGLEAFVRAILSFNGQRLPTKLERLLPRKTVEDAATKTQARVGAAVKTFEGSVFVNLAEVEDQAEAAAWIDKAHLFQIGLDTQTHSQIMTSKKLVVAMEPLRSPEYQALVSMREQRILAQDGPSGEVNSAGRDQADRQLMYEQLEDESSLLRKLIMPSHPEFRRQAETEFFWVEDQEKPRVIFLEFTAMAQFYICRLQVENTGEDGRLNPHFEANMIDLGINTPSMMLFDFRGENSILEMLPLASRQKLAERLFLETDLLAAPFANQVGWLYLLDEFLKKPKEFEKVARKYQAGELNDFIARTVSIILISPEQGAKLIDLPWMKKFLELWFETYRDSDALSQLDSKLWQSIKAHFGSDFKTPNWILRYKPKVEKKRPPQRRKRSSMKGEKTPPGQNSGGGSGEKVNPGKEDPGKVTIKTSPIDLDIEALWVQLEDGQHQFTIPKTESGFTVYVRASVVRNGMASSDAGFEWKAFQAGDICDLSEIYGGKIVVEMVAASEPFGKTFASPDIIRVAPYKHVRAPQKTTANVFPKPAPKPAPRSPAPQKTPPKTPHSPTKVEPTSPQPPSLEVAPVMSESEQTLQETARQFRRRDFLLPNGIHYLWDRDSAQGKPMPQLGGVEADFHADPKQGLRWLKLNTTSFQVTITFFEKQSKGIHRFPKPELKIDRAEESVTRTEIMNIVWGWLYESAFMANPALKARLEAENKNKEEAAAAEEEKKKKNFLNSKSGKERIKSIQKKLAEGQAVTVMTVVNGQLTYASKTLDEMFEEDEIILQSPAILTGDVAASYEGVYDAVRDSINEHTIYARIRRTVKARLGVKYDRDKIPFENSYADIALAAVAELKLDPDLIAADESRSMAEVEAELEDPNIKKLVPLFIDMVRVKNRGLVFNSPFTLTKAQILKAKV